MTPFSLRRRTRTGPGRPAEPATEPATEPAAESAAGSGAAPATEPAALTPAVAPAAVELSPRWLRAGDGYAATLVVTGYPAEVGPAWLEPLLSWPGRLDLSLHIDPVATPVAAARLRRQRARFESSRRADTARGRLSDPAVDAAAEDAAALADQLARGAAKLFRVGLYLTVHARTETALAEACTQVTAAAASTLIDVQPATWRQLAGWSSTLPLAADGLQQQRTMDTAALAAAFPLASADLPAPLPGDPPATSGVLYGANPDSQGIVWWDRWAQENHNTVVLARSGAGKSYLVKLDVLRNLYQGVHVAVVDPEDEYLRLAGAVGGTVVQLGAPGVKLNPLDLPAGDPRPDALTRRAMFLHTLVAVLLGELPAPAEQAALDRAVLSVYRTAGITADPDTHHRPAPLFTDVATALSADGDPAGRLLAGRLTPWVSGSFSALFDAPSTVRPDGHLVVWSLRQLPDELRTAGTLLAIDAIWRGVDAPARPQRRIVVVDEAWLLLRDGEGARFLLRMSKAARKRNAGLTVVTQDVADLLGSDIGQAVAAGAATQLLLKQAPQAIEQVAASFGLTAGERQMLLGSPVGHGLLVCGTQRSAFAALASATEHRLCTTSPAELALLEADPLTEGLLEEDLP